MRRFRGLTKDGKWVYGWYSESWTVSSSYKSVGPHIRCFDLDNNFVEFEVILGTVGQQVGLKDKNSKDCYFGDIVRHNNGDIGIIEWDEGRCGACFKWPHSKYDTKSFPISNADYIDFEIIGSIHTTTKLMEQDNGK